jgi:hypothetical protein
LVIGVFDDQTLAVRSRDSFYRFREVYDQGGELALQVMSYSFSLGGNDVEVRTH